MFLIFREFCNKFATIDFTKKFKFKLVVDDQNDKDIVAVTEACVAKFHIFVKSAYFLHILPICH